MSGAVAIAAPPPVTYDGALESYRLAVVTDLGAERHARKKLAQIQDCNERTAKGHIEGQNLPGVPEFLRACQQLPTLKAWVREVLQMQTDMDPRVERELANLLRTYSEIQKRQK